MVQNTKCVALTAVSYCNFAIISSAMPHTCFLKKAEPNLAFRNFSASIFAFAE